MRSGTTEEDEGAETFGGVSFRSASRFNVDIRFEAACAVLVDATGIWSVGSKRELRLVVSTGLCDCVKVVC